MNLTTMMTTWSIQLNPAGRQQLNDVLSLYNHNQTSTFKSWFGALAGEIFNSIKASLNIPLATAKPLDKTQAQHVLIQATMVQQHCMHYYRVYHDLSSLGVKDLAWHDLLLFIRMSNYHPNTQDLMQFQRHSPMIESRAHLQNLLIQLQKKRLIQQITANNTHFYDKNPYPHCHLLDTQTNRISDYDCHLNNTHNIRFIRIPHVETHRY